MSEYAGIRFVPRKGDRVSVYACTGVVRERRRGSMFYKDGGPKGDPGIMCWEGEPFLVDSAGQYAVEMNDGGRTHWIFARASEMSLSFGVGRVAEPAVNQR